MDPLLVVSVALAVVFFAICVYLEWLGLLSLMVSRDAARHAGCGHRKLTPANEGELCWWCRHQHIEHALHPASMTHARR